MEEVCQPNMVSSTMICCRKRNDGTCQIAQNTCSPPQHSAVRLLIPPSSPGLPPCPACLLLRVPCQVAELCEAASKEVPAGEGVRIANFLCNGNYAVSGGIAGCEAVEKLAKSFKARWVGGWVGGGPRQVSTLSVHRHLASHYGCSVEPGTKLCFLCCVLAV